MDFKNERLMMSEEEIRKRAKELLNENQADLIIKYMFLEQQAKKQKEVIDKAVSILKDNFVYDYVRSCDTTDGVGYDEIDTEHFTYKVYELLKEASK